MAEAEELAIAFRRYYPPLREKCRRMLRDAQEADDVAQETFVRYWQAALPPGAPARTLAWLYKTSTRLAIDRLRSAALRRRAPQEPEPRAPDLAGGVEARAELARLAARLPARELELLLLSRCDLLTHAEIAEVTGDSPRTVRRLLKRCEHRLERIAQDGEA